MLMGGKPQELERAVVKMHEGILGALVDESNRPVSLHIARNNFKQALDSAERALPEGEARRILAEPVTERRIVDMLAERNIPPKEIQRRLVVYRILLAMHGIAGQGVARGRHAPQARGVRQEAARPPSQPRRLPDAEAVRKRFAPRRLQLPPQERSDAGPPAETAWRTPLQRSAETRLTPGAKPFVFGEGSGPQWLLDASTASVQAAIRGVYSRFSIRLSMARDPSAHEAEMAGLFLSELRKSVRSGVALQDVAGEFERVAESREASVRETLRRIRELSGKRKPVPANLPSPDAISQQSVVISAFRRAIGQMRSEA